MIVKYKKLRWRHKITQSVSNRRSCLPLLWKSQNLTFTIQCLNDLPLLFKSCWDCQIQILSITIVVPQQGYQPSPPTAMDLNIDQSLQHPHSLQRDLTTIRCQWLQSMLAGWHTSMPKQQWLQHFFLII
uniref:Uncharacterized protein n=1 Tax=Cacopsylla melanoneura TaxID=428564 RepID=A0A8D8QJN9_9HEMI